MRAYRQLYIEQNPEAIRTEKFDGRDHVVVPAIVLVEGVLQGANSAFPELALEGEFGKFTDMWNGRPVTLSHPMRQGQFVSASSAPEVFESEAVGMVFNSKVEDGKLKVEFFLDPAKAGQDEITRLTSGSTAEVSTGFFADVLEAKGNFGGRDFEGILTGIVPDHIALLSEEEIGACSVADGCGAPRINKLKVNRQGKMEVETKTLARVAVKAKARTPKFEGTETEAWVTADFGVYKAAWQKRQHSDKITDFSGLSDAPEGFREFVACHSLLGNAEGSTLREVCFFPAVNPASGKLNEGALRAIVGDRGIHANISEGSKDSARAKARNLLNSEFDVGLSASARRKAFNNFFTIEDGKAKDLGETKPAGLETTAEEFIVISEDSKSVLGRHGTKASAEAAAEKSADASGGTTIVGRAVGKKDGATVWKDVVGFVGGKGEKAMKKSEVETCEKKVLDNSKNVAQDAPDVAEDGNFISTLATKVKRLLQREDNDMDKAELINQVITNEATGFVAGDAEALEAFSEERLTELAAASNDKHIEVESEDEATQDEAATLETFTSSDAFAALPEEVRAHLTRTMDAEKAETEALVTELAAEASVLLGEDALRAKFDLAELREIKAKVDAAKPKEDYSGKGGPKANSGEEKVYAAPETGRIWKFKTAQGE